MYSLTIHIHVSFRSGKKSFPFAMPATPAQMNLVKNIWHQLNNNPKEKLQLATTFLCACSRDQVEELISAGEDLRAAATPATKEWHG